VRTKWFYLKEQDFKELLRLSHMYHREAIRCENSKAYTAGCVMAGACLETSLLMMVHLYGNELETAGFVPKMKQKYKPLFKWTFKELVLAARGMNWLPTGLQIGAEWNTRRAKIGDYAEVLRQFRNLVHPVRYLQDHSPSRVTIKHLKMNIDIVELACEHLGAKVNASLQKKLGIVD